MAKVLILSRYGDGLDYAIDAKRDGHEAKCWIQDPKRRHTVYEGLVDKVDDFKEALGWADFVFCDANHLEKEWAVCKKAGKMIWNGSPEGNKMEQDRAFARDLFEKKGMKPLASDFYKTIPEAVKAIQGKKGLRVSKVVGGDSDSHDVTLGERESGEDLIDVLLRYEESGKKYDGVEIEDRVLGIEMGCARYYSRGVPCGPIEINFQHKEIAAGWPGADRGLGALCGETGTVGIYVEEDNAFYQKSLALFEDYFKSIEFTGEIDLGGMVDETGAIVPIEFTSGRPGYPDSFMRRALSKTSQMEFFRSAVEGNPIPFETMPGWMICFLVMVPGFPDQDSVEKYSAGCSVEGYDEKNVNMHLQEVTTGKRGLEVARGQGYAAVVSGRGATIEAARRNAHWLIHPANEKRLSIQKMSIRADIGERVINQKDEIIDRGLMTPEEWGS